MVSRAVQKMMHMNITTRITILITQSMYFIDIILNLIIIIIIIILDTYQITEYDPNNESKLTFAVPYHYSNQILNNISNIAPSRARRLAQEVSSLSTSLPLSLSSTVFLCCDEERLDVMKVTLHVFTL